MPARYTRDAVAQLTEDGMRPAAIAARLGHPATNVAYHLRVARRAEALPPTARPKPGPARRTPARWTGADDFPPAVEVADQVTTLGLDGGVPVHDLARLADRLRVPGMPLPRSAPGRHDIMQMPGKVST